MKTAFWTTLAAACGFMCAASATGVIYEGLGRLSILDAVLYGVFTYMFGLGTRVAWRAAKGPQDAVAAELPKDEPRRPWER